MKGKFIYRGEKRALMDAMGKPIQADDAKGAMILNSYDDLHRPIRLWARDDGSAGLTLRQYLIYGDDTAATGYNPTVTADLNLYGKIWKHFDEAGLTFIEDYDFKGNILEKNRQVISDTELLSVFVGPPVNWQVEAYRVDWTGLNTGILDSFEFITSITYDALNRVMSMFYPEDVNSNRKELVATYNKAGALLKVDLAGTEYVKEIAYNAKGQRLLIAYGNEMMTRYVYDENTFRLERLKTEKYAFAQVGNTHTYAPQSGSTRQDFAYQYDLIGNILSLNDVTPDCGVGATPDELLREFDYDPLYRLLSASGRESDNQSPNLQWADAPVCGTPNASNAQGYTRHYEYDKMGNVLKLQQTGTNAFTRLYAYNTGVNTLAQITDNNVPPNTLCGFSYGDTGNMIQSNTERFYEWDAGNQLKSFYIQTGTSEPSIYAQYLYDASGQRTKKIVRTAGGNYEVTVYIDGIFEYCKKVNGTTYEKNYCHIMDGTQRIAMVRERSLPVDPSEISDDVVYILGDNLGSSNVRLNDAGGIIDKEEYYPFGDSSLRTFSSKRYRYVGREKDQESGLYYYGARYYASWTCRFISADPLAGQYAQLTPYNYADNNPINDLDIDGMQSVNSAKSADSTVSSGFQGKEIEQPGILLGKSNILIANSKGPTQENSGKIGDVSSGEIESAKDANQVADELNDNISQNSNGQKVIERYTTALKREGYKAAETHFQYQILEAKDPKLVQTAKMGLTETETRDLPAQKTPEGSMNTFERGEINVNDKTIKVEVFFQNYKANKDKTITKITNVTWTGKKENINPSGQTSPGSESGYYMLFKNKNQFLIGFLRFDTKSDLNAYVNANYDKSRKNFYVKLFKTWFQNSKPTEKDMRIKNEYAANKNITESNY